MNWEFCFYRSCRKSNVCADALVSMTCENGSSFILYKQCLLGLVYYFELAGCTSVSTPHLIRSFFMFWA